MATSTTRKERKLSDSQIRVLKVLKRKPHTVTETVELLNKAATRRSGYAFNSTENTYFAVHGSLRRLEDRGYVRRVSTHKDKTVWELTAKGSNAIS